MQSLFWQPSLHTIMALGGLRSAVGVHINNPRAKGYAAADLNSRRRDCMKDGAGLPEVEKLILLEIADRTAMRALHIIRHDLQVGFHVHCCPGYQQQVAAELSGVCLLRFLLHPDVAVKDSSPRPRSYNAPAQAQMRIRRVSARAAFHTHVKISVKSCLAPLSTSLHAWASSNANALSGPY